MCIVPTMTVSMSLLGLLEAGPRHGYDLKRIYDERFGQDKPLAYGQVYSTLSRLMKSGLIEAEGVEPGSGPDRKRYAITAEGVTDVATWLRSPEKPEQYLTNTMYAKVVIALMSGRPAAEVLEVQRAAHLDVMRTLTRRKRAGDLVDALICDHALFHLEADIRWLELTASRLDALTQEVNR